MWWCSGESAVDVDGGKQSQFPCYPRLKGKENALLSIFFSLISFNVFAEWRKPFSATASQEVDKTPTLPSLRPASSSLQVRVEQRRQRDKIEGK